MLENNIIYYNVNVDLIVIFLFFSLDYSKLLICSGDGRYGYFIFIFF